MRRAALLAITALLALAVAASASAADFRGVVVAKDVKRGTIVTVSKSGKVREVRAPKKAKKLKVGQHVRVKAKRLRDGTLALRSLRTFKSEDAEGDEVEIEGTLVSAEGGEVVVNGGGSLVTCAGVVPDGIQPGAFVEITCDLVNGQWLVRKVELEDDEGDGEDDNDDEGDDEDEDEDDEGDTMWAGARLR
jgi:hypothetical protein